MCRCNVGHGRRDDRRDERRNVRSEREEVLERAFRELRECDCREERRSRRHCCSRSCCR